MTHLAILSDIHGNLSALETVLADMAQFQVDHVIVAGDVINWGPFSAEVMERVTSEGWAVIRGNNEFYLIDYQTPRAPREWNDATQWTMLPWLHRQLNGRWRHVIAAWPDSLCLRFPDAPPIRVVHGTPRSAWESIFPAVSEAEANGLLTGVEETTVIAGHSHLAMDRQVGRWHILNPGSVGTPLHGIHEATYMLLEGREEGWQATLRRVPLDPTPVIQAFERQGFIDECGIIGHFVIEEYKTARLHLLPFLKWRQATCPTAPFHISLLDIYASIDPWDYTPSPYCVNLPPSTVGGGPPTGARG